MIIVPFCALPNIIIVIFCLFQTQQVHTQDSRGNNKANDSSFDNPILSITLLRDIR